jgi:Ca2+-binding RTX toxin-like protein
MMAQLNYTTAGSTGHDMRTLDFDFLVGTAPVFGFNAFTVQWKDAGQFLPRLSLIGDDLVATVSGNALTELTGTRLVQLTLFSDDYNFGLIGLDVSATAFFDLVQAKNWAGLAVFVRQGDDRVLGTHNNDTLLGGDGNDTFVSNAGRDLIYGGTGNDTMEAMGGHDVMTGGQGADQFQFAMEPEPNDGNWVTIRDFKHGIDRIAVSDTAFNHVGFGGFTGAVMDASHFHVGRNAVTGDQGIVYNKAKGLLYYDADGSGSQADKVLFAKVDPGTVLTAEDFWVI